MTEQRVVVDWERMIIPTVYPYRCCGKPTQPNRYIHPPVDDCGCEWPMNYAGTDYEYNATVCRVHRVYTDPERGPEYWRAKEQSIHATVTERHNRDRLRDLRQEVKALEKTLGLRPGDPTHPRAPKREKVSA